MFSVGGFLCGRHGSISLRVFFVRYEKIFLVASFVRKTNERIFRIVFVRYEKNFRAVRKMFCDIMQGMEVMLMAGESRNLEYKADMTNSFLKTVSAYANYGAGEIRFGISDDGEHVGVKEPEAFALSVENKINDAIEPKPNFSMALDGDVVILRVAKGMDPPYTYRGKAYKRNHTATVEVSREEMRRLVLEGTGKSFDQLAAREERLTFSCLAEDLSTRLGIGSISQDILKTLGLYHDQEGYNNAAALLADENSFPGIDVVRFGAGLDEIVERERFSGVSVLLQYKRVVEMFQRYYQYEAIKGFSRVDREIVPDKAFREAIANALAHRMWDSAPHIQVMMFADRIEVASPGGLPTDISEEEYLRGNISLLRNPVLGNVLFRLRYIENMGSGVRRISEAYAGSSAAPRFEFFEKSLRVILPSLSQGNEILSTEEKMVYDLLTNAALSRSEIAVKSGYGRSRVLRILHKLVEMRLVKVRGSGRGTRYSRF